MKDLSVLNNREIDELQERLEALHEAELQEIYQTNQTHKEYLERELMSMEGLLKERDMELKMLMEEKLEMKNMFIEEGNQMKADVEGLQY